MNVTNVWQQHITGVWQAVAVVAAATIAGVAFGYFLSMWIIWMWAERGRITLTRQ